MDAIPAEVAARTEAPEQLGKDGHWQPFGKEMCIINVDSRGHDGRVRDLSNVTEILQQVEYGTVGAYRNLMYAIRHGYSYHLVVAPEWPGHESTWVKIPQIYAVLRYYRCALIFDGDAFISEPRVPKAFDVSAERSDCLKKTEGCHQWAFEWAHEQSAFTEYFRTEDRLVEGKDLIIVPCDEGNGSGLVGCAGILVTQLWMRPVEERMDRLLGSIMVNILTLLEDAISEGNTVLRRMPSSEVADLKGIELLGRDKQPVTSLYTSIEIETRNMQHVRLPEYAATRSRHISHVDGQQPITLVTTATEGKESARLVF